MVGNEDFDRVEELRAPDTVLFAGVVVAVSVRSGIRDTRRRDDPNGLRNGWLRVGERRTVLICAISPCHNIWFDTDCQQQRLTAHHTV